MPNNICVSCGKSVTINNGVFDDHYNWYCTKCYNRRYYNRRKRIKKGLEVF